MPFGVALDVGILRKVLQHLLQRQTPPLQAGGSFARSSSLRPMSALQAWPSLRAWAAILVPACRSSPSLMWPRQWPFSVLSSSASCRRHYPDGSGSPRQVAGGPRIPQTRERRLPRSAPHGRLPALTGGAGRFRPQPLHQPPGGGHVQHRPSPDKARATTGRIGTIPFATLAPSSPSTPVGATPPLAPSWPRG